MIVDGNDHHLLEVDVLDDSPGPLVLIWTCRRCGRELSRRTYAHDRGAKAVGRHAAAAAQRDLDSICLAV